ncbi:MAG: acyl-CoA dehydrogenase, partial [Rhodospirillales bacterium]
MQTTYILLAGGIILFLGLLYSGRGYWAWVFLAVALLAAWDNVLGPSTALKVAGAVVAVLAAVFGIPAVRRAAVSAPLMRMAGKILPAMGETERIALEAGTVWWDGELFSGNPDWKKLLDFKVHELTERERAFIDGPVEQLCAMLDDWRTAQDRDFSDEVWDFIKRERFFGMIIPEKYGGLGFSAIAHSQVITKISSRSVAAAVTVMVPNSLGPGELILHYGTDEQKDHYLPRLASGQDVPCFALTEPGAGSDAASTKSAGIVCKGRFDGEEVLGVRLNWAKRYITLAPIATVVGLAFKLFDPDGLLGGAEELGITCALIPPGLEGVEIGDHHDPMGVPFHNGPIFGVNVFIPLSFVIGGEDGIGQGWRMLMESLSAGRSISLPSLSVGAVQLAARVAGAYGTVREQFNLPIGKFEGVEEPLARIGGYAYLMNAVRILTCGAVDAGEKPAVLSAIAKAYLTEGMRGCLNDAFDIRAGAAICRGPNNILGRGFIGVPISITVEGANILTRSLIIYGQGVIRCHPFVHDEMEAVAKRDL